MDTKNLGHSYKGIYQLLKFLGLGLIGFVGSVELTIYDDVKIF